jgi:hypothetical protein
MDIIIKCNDQSPLLNVFNLRLTSSLFINYDFIVELDFKNKIIILHMSAKGDKCTRKISRKGKINN